MIGEVESLFLGIFVGANATHESACYLDGDPSCYPTPSDCEQSAFRLDPNLLSHRKVGAESADPCIAAETSQYATNYSADAVNAEYVQTIIIAQSCFEGR